MQQLLKNYLQEGLLQIAVVLSLLRVDLSSVSDLRNQHQGTQGHYPSHEHEPVSVMLQVQDLYNLDGNYLHPKSVTRNYSHPRAVSSVFDDLHDLGIYDTMRFQPPSYRNINAFVVTEDRSLANEESSQQWPSLHPENNVPMPMRDEECSNDTQAADAELSIENIDVDSDGGELQGCHYDPGTMDTAVNFVSDALASNLTDEDLDLIEILWQQDIDLGISKDAFTSIAPGYDDWFNNYSSPVDVHAVEKLDDEPGSEPFLVQRDGVAMNNRSENYAVDAETGEQLAVPVEMGATTVNESPVDAVNVGEVMSTQLQLMDITTQAEGPAVVGSSLSRLHSVEHRWADVQELIASEQGVETNSTLQNNTSPTTNGALIQNDVSLNGESTQGLMNNDISFNGASTEGLIHNAALPVGLIHDVSLGQAAAVSPPTRRDQSRGASGLQLENQLQFRNSTPPTSSNNNEEALNADFTSDLDAILAEIANAPSPVGIDCENPELHCDQLASLVPAPPDLGTVPQNVVLVPENHQPGPPTQILVPHVESGSSFLTEAPINTGVETALPGAACSSNQIAGFPSTRSQIFPNVSTTESAASHDASFDDEAFYDVGDDVDFMQLVSNVTSGDVGSLGAAGTAVEAEREDAASDSALSSMGGSPFPPSVTPNADEFESAGAGAMGWSGASGSSYYYRQSTKGPAAATNAKTGVTSPVADAAATGAGFTGYNGNNDPLQQYRHLLTNISHNHTYTPLTHLDALGGGAGEAEPAAHPHPSLSSTHTQLPSPEPEPQPSTSNEKRDWLAEATNLPASTSFANAVSRVGGLKSSGDIAAAFGAGRFHAGGASNARTGQSEARSGPGSSRSGQQQQAGMSRLSRDELAAQRLRVPYTVDEIVHSPVREYQRMIDGTDGNTLTDEQLQLIKDIRRRGKNKVAAQECRKRKLRYIDFLEDEIQGLTQRKAQLLQSDYELDASLRSVHEAYSSLECEIINTLLHLHHGQQGHDTHEFMLVETGNGNFDVVRRQQRNVRQRQLSVKSSGGSRVKRKVEPS